MYKIIFKRQLTILSYFDELLSTLKIKDSFNYLPIFHIGTSGLSCSMCVTHGKKYTWIQWMNQYTR